jgi:hypothetical protein
MVVLRVFSRAIPRSPWAGISRSTVHRATRTPCRLSWAWTFRAPYTPRFAAWAALISATSSASRTARAEGGRVLEA